MGQNESGLHLGGKITPLYFGEDKAGRCACLTQYNRTR